MDIIERNFFNLIRSGGLNEFVPLEPMSAYKWRKLMAIATEKHIEGMIIKGLRHHQYDTEAGIPKELQADNSTTEGFDINETQTALASFFLNKRLNKIHYNELHAIDTSVETLELLDIIIRCITAMLNSDASINRLLRLGIFLRSKGDKVDFIKLDNWLRMLHLQRMAQLQGCILIQAFGFEQDELPFVHKQEPDTGHLLDYSFKHADDEYEEWHIKENRSPFLKTNSRALVHKLRRCNRYFKYAPLEAFSNLLHNIARSLSEIEE